VENHQSASWSEALLGQGPEASTVDSRKVEDEMRRALIGLAVAAFTVLAFAGPASAAPGQVKQVTHLKFSGTFADAGWYISSATSSTSTYVNVSQSTQGTELSVDQYTQNLDANGNFTGATDTFADVTSGFSLTIEKSLGSASTSGSGLPATTCTYDANYNQIGCSDTTIDVNASWTGQGPITRGVFNQHFKTVGFSENDHFGGTNRAATATGTVGGLTLSAADLQFADLGTTKSGTTTICIGSSC
jgi:hypothetical protein